MKGILCLIFNLLAWEGVYAQTAQQIAPTPPMGWNSYNCFGSAVHEEEVRENADYMASHLKQYSWQYIIVDYCWSYPNPPGGTLNNVPQFRLTDSSYVPWLTMDEYGRLWPDEKKFPSARDGKGFKPLADYVHSLGLKFGIHVMRGIPRQAVWAKTKIKGTDLDASMAADTNKVCSWLNHMYGVAAEKDAGQAYYNSLIELYASWGVDYIKLDDMTSDVGDRPYYKQEAEAIHKAIMQSGRPIVLSLSPLQFKKNAASLEENANLYRISEDFWDTWPQLKEQFDFCAEWAGAGRPGHWPDADMLQLGKISKRGPKYQERFSRLTEDEQLTHVTLWCMFRSPLMMGGNMPENTPFVSRLLTNRDVLEIDQESTDNKQLYRKGGTVVWVSRMPATGDWNIAFFNLNDQEQTIQLDFSSLALKGAYQVKDLWSSQVLGIFKTRLTRNVKPHGTALLRLSKH